IIFLVIIVGIFAALAIVTNMNNKEKSEGNPYNKETLDPKTIALLDDENYQNIITPDKLEKKLAENKDVTVYFFKSDCPACMDTTPIIAPLAKEMNIDLVQFNLLEFDSGWDDYEIEFTPTIVHYKNGKE